MALVKDLERIAVAATTHGEVSGVLAAEPSWGRRLYLVALGELSSPFSTAIRSATGAVDEFVQDVERGYLVELR